MKKLISCFRKKFIHRKSCFRKSQNYGKRKKTKKDIDPSNDIATIIHYLNEKTNKHFNPHSKTSNRMIKAILKEGYTVEDCYLVIDEQVRNWMHDPQMYKYLRPMTLFRPGNFESYLNNALTRLQDNDYVPAPVVLDFDEGDYE